MPRKGRAHPALRVVLLAALVLGAARTARAEPSALAPAEASVDTRAILTLVVNHAPGEEVTVLLRGRDVLVRPEDLAKARVRWPSAPVEVVAGVTYVSLARLGPAIFFGVDERALTLNLELSPAMLEGTVVDLAPRRPKNIRYTKDAGAFFNYAPRLTDVSVGEAYGELGVSVGGNLFFASGTVSTQHGGVRGLTSYTIDERERLRRWTVGDAYVNGGPLGSTLYLGGASVGRAFDLDPYLVTVPSPSAWANALTPSTLEVYVNGTLTRRENVAPGSIDIKNLPAQAGAGTATYVLRDVFGREQRLVSPYYRSAGLLARGLSDWSIAAGAPRLGMGRESFHYGAPGVLARYRFGATDALTPSLRAETNAERANVGTGATLNLGKGQLDAAAAWGMTREGEGGGAGSLAYQTVVHGFAGGMAVGATAPRYVTMMLDPRADRALVDGHAFVGVPISRRASLTTTGSVLLMRDAGLTVRVGAMASVQIARRASLMLSASRSREANGNTPIETFVTFTYSFESGMSASLGARTVDREIEARAEVNKPLPVGTGYGFRASATAGKTPRSDAMVVGQTSFGRAQVSVAATGQEVHHTLEYAGAIVFVPRAGFFFSRPVAGAVALVRVPGVKGARVEVENQEVARTDANGDALVPSLLPYYGNRVRIVAEDLPMDYEVDTNEQTIAPPTRGAAVVEFVARRASFFRGRVRVLSHGARADVAYGELTVDGERAPVISPIGKEGDFEVDGVTPGAHRVHVSYAAGTCDMTVQFPSARGPVVEMGELSCVH